MKVRNVTWVVLLTVSVSSCKDGKERRKSENKKEVHLYPNWSEGLRSLIWQK
jgi:hypothetical protein